jgi:hypothetical protein
VQPPATQADLELLTGQSVDADRAEFFLQAATDALVAELGWDPEQSVRTATVFAGARTTFLPVRNLTVVSAAPNFGEIGVSFTRDGMVRFTPWAIRDLTLTYTAGWPAAELPGVLRQVVLDYARSMLEAPAASGVRSQSWTVGGESETITYAGGEGTTGPSLSSDRRLDGLRLGAVVA